MFSLQQPLLIPIILGGIILIILTVWLFARTQKNKKSLETYSNTNRFTQTPAYRKALKKYIRLLYLPVAVLLVAVLTTTTIAAQPTIIELEKNKKYNRDIVLCLDVSGSMFSVDAEILSTFEDLIKGFKGERVGLIIWNSNSHQVFPLTDDYSYMLDNIAKVKKPLESVFINPEDPEIYDIFTSTSNGSGSSLIGDGLASCTIPFEDMTKEDTERSKSIILATDNQIAGTQIITLQDAAEETQKLDINLYTIDPGTPGATENDPSTELKNITESIGGTYYPLRGGGFVEDIVEQISATEAAEIESQPVIKLTEIPQNFIWVLLIIMFIYLTIMWRTKE